MLAACGSDSASDSDDEPVAADSTEADTATYDDDATDDTATGDDAEAPDSADADADAGDADAEETVDAVASENVEINLIDELDGILNGYCLDIAGGNENVDPANGLQAHTCYSYDGDLGTDQIFDTATFSDNQLYMPVYDVCAEVASASAGATIGLATCDGNDLQNIVFDADGTIRPSGDTSLCFTAGAESRTGRSGDHQIRDLSLEACSDDLASLQQWSFRTGL